MIYGIGMEMFKATHHLTLFGRIKIFLVYMLMIRRRVLGL